MTYTSFVWRCVGVLTACNNMSAIIVSRRYSFMLDEN